MYTLFRSIPCSRMVKEQLPTLLISMLCAEAFYKFHSFTLECLAFLATWFVADAVFSTFGSWLRRRLEHAAGSR